MTSIDPDETDPPSGEAGITTATQAGRVTARPGAGEAPNRAGPYQLLDELGRGGMGRVMRAHDPRLGREVAIKVLTAVGATARLRFEREARITARLQHPAIVPVYEVAGSTEPYYAMKLVRGETLSALIVAAHTLPERLALLRHVLVVAEAIAYAHGQRIIHRDLKSANVVVGAFGETVVIDWGLAKDLADSADPAPDAGPYRRTGDSDGALTEAGTVMGTPAYMSPEQAMADPVDERTDVYAIGVMLYHLLCGELPYQGKSGRAILAAVAEGPPPPLVERVPEVPRDLAAIVSKAMARDADARYPTAAELAGELARFQAGQLVAAHSYRTSELLGRWLRRHRAAVVVATVAMIAATVGGVLAVRSVIAARDRARVAQQVAERELARATRAEAAAIARADDATLAAARELLDDDPRGALTRLLELSPGSARWDQVRTVAADAMARGVRIPIGELDGPGSLAIAADGTVIATDADQLLRAAPGQPVSIVAAPLAAAAADGSAVAWRDGGDIVIDSAGTIRRVPVAGVVAALAVAPGGDAIAVISGGEVARHDLGDGVRHRLGEVARDDDTGHPPWVRFAAGSTVVVTGRSLGGVRAWRGDGTRVATPDELWTFDASADGRWQAFKSQAGLVLRDTHSETDRTIVEGGGGGTVRFDPSGRWLALIVPSEHEVTLWDLTTSTRHRLVGHRDPPEELAFARDGRRLATTGRDGTVRVWDLARLLDQGGWPFADGGPSARMLSYPLGAVGVAVGFEPVRGEVVSMTADGVVARWSVVAPVVHRAGGPVTRSPDGRWLATIDGATIEVTALDGAAGPVLRRDDYQAWYQISGAGQLVDSWPMPHFAAARPVLLFAAAKAVVRWHLDTDRVDRLATPTQITELASSPDGTAIAIRDVVDEVYLLRDGVAPAKIAAPGRRQAMAFSDDGSYLAVQADAVHVIRVADAGVVAVPAGEVVAFGSDARVLIGGHDQPLSSCELSTGRCAILAGGDGATMIVAGAGGRVVAALRHGEVVTWAGTEAARVVLGHHRADVADGTISPDGARAVTFGPGPEVRLWELGAAASRVLRAEISQPSEARFDGDRVVVTSGRALHAIADDLPRDEASLRARIAAELAR